MEQDELKAHRKWIQIQIAVMRQKFFITHMQPQVYEAFMLSWADALQDYSQEEISKAIAQYISQSPKIAPNEGHIKQIIMRNRPRVKPVPKEPEPKKDLPTIEERKKIAASLGLKVVP